MFIFFFFSSRRRHTRWNCDWSSDVCSSDLQDLLAATVQALLQEIPGLGEVVAFDTTHLYAFVKENNLRVYVKDRSEEHTSELQSQFHLVCRLLLEKKNSPHSSKSASIILMR